jgi:hypothetical protein
MHRGGRGVHVHHVHPPWVRPWYVFSVHVLIVFTTFCFLVDEKIKHKFLACSFEILSNFENPSSNPLQRTKSGDFDSETAHRKPPVINGGQSYFVC